MITPTHDERSDTGKDPEIHALEKMLEARCQQIEHMVKSTPMTGREMSREKDFQLQAFIERREQVQQQLTAGAKEPRSARISRLEQLLEALHCSREFFDSVSRENSSEEEEWAVLIR